MRTLYFLSLFTALLGIFMLCTYESALAEDDAEKKRPAVIKVSNIYKIESIGIFKTPQQGSLGRDMWSNGNRVNVPKLMSLLPASTENKALQRIRNGVLLTSANAKLLKGKLDSEKNDDLFTLRLENLLRIGAYEYAAKMYDELDQEPYSPRLAKAGIMTFLLNGEKALGCLEYQTVADRDFSNAAETDDFWGDIALYCDYALSVNEERKKAIKALSDADNQILKNISLNERYKTSYSRNRFERLDLFSHAILKADERINKTSLAAINFKDVPPNHLELLYNEGDIEDNPRTPFLLNMQRLRWGLTDALSINSFVKRNKKAFETSTPKGWLRMPSFYKKIEESEGVDEKLEVFDAHMYLERAYGTAAFLPIVGQLREITKEKLTQAQQLLMIRILHHAGLSWPSKWNESVLENEKTALNGDISKVLFAISLNNLISNKVEKDNIDHFNSILSKNNIIHDEIIKLLVEKLDKYIENNHNHIKVYEKDALTSPVQPYPLPGQALWNGLRQAGINQSISEVLMLTTLIMHDLQGQKIYPGIMQDTFKSLDAVGLTNISKDLVNSLFLGQ